MFGMKQTDKRNSQYFQMQSVSGESSSKMLWNKKKSPPKIMIIMSVMAISKKLLIKVFFEMDITEIIPFNFFYIYIYFLSIFEDLSPENDCIWKYCEL